MAQEPDRQTSSTRLPAVLLAFVLLYMGLIAYRMRDYVMDDAYIGLRCVANLLAGDGLVFNPGERVESVTNVGWLLLLSVLSPLAPLPVLAKVVGLLCAAASVCLCYCLLQRLYGRCPGALLLVLPVPFFLAIHFDYVFYSVGGMETGLLSLLLCAMVYAALGGHSLALAAMGVAAMLLHPECVLVFPLWWVATARRTNLRDHRRWAAVAVFGALLAGVGVARYAYYQDLVPNTFYSKPSDLAQIVSSFQHSLGGANANFPAPFRGLLALPFLAFGVISLRRKLPGAAGIALAVVATGWLFSAYARADWTGTGRYFAPYVPVAFLLLWVGLIEAHSLALERLTGKTHVPAVALVYAVLIAFVGAGEMSRRLSPEFAESYPGYVMAGRNLVEPCRWIAAHTPPDAVIATRRIGAVGYIAHREVFDYTFGLIHRSVARRISAIGKPFDDPLPPELADLWRERAPDYFLEDLWIVERTAKEAGGSLSNFPVHGFRYGVTRRFAVGEDAEWVLCRRHPDFRPPPREGAHSR